MAKAVEQPVSRIDELEDRIAAMQRREEIMRKYGSQLTDDQIAKYQEIEDRQRRMAEKHARTPALVAQERDRIEKEKNRIAADLCQSGAIALFINKERAHLDGRTAPKCPHCNEPILEANGLIYTVASRVFESQGDLFAAAA
ncbi:hypothetical protein, partial [Methanocalculus sp.]|uniref:hypothetical protein n=1 Tax=Methanocalculus sp. TaxID=2004547 RepID=UPI00260CDDE4